MESFNVVLILLVAVFCSWTEAADSISGHGLDSAHLPQNVAVLAGDDVTFTCWADSNTTPRILWYEFAYAIGGTIISNGTFVSPSHPQAARYRIVHERPEQYDLVIHNVTLNDGGGYICQDVNSGPSTVFLGYAELIVIGGDQRCWTSIPNTDSNQEVVEGTTFTSECTINYKGNHRPYMHWHGPQPFDQVKTNTSTTLYSAMQAVADRSMDQGSWRSVVNFTAPLTPPAADTATNVPDFEMTYTTPTITVRSSVSSSTTLQTTTTNPPTANPSTANPSAATTQLTTKPTTDATSTGTIPLTATSPQATDLTSRTTTKAPPAEMSNFLFALAIFVFFFVLISFIILSVCFVILLRRQREPMNGAATKQFDDIVKQ